MCERLQTDGEKGVFFMKLKSLAYFIMYKWDICDIERRDLATLLLYETDQT